MSGLPRTWPPVAACAVVLVASVPFFDALIRVSGTNPYAGHVILVPILAGVLAWFERHRFRGLPRPDAATGAAATGVALAMLGIAYARANVPLQAVSLVAAVAGLSLWFHGPEGLRRRAFLLAFLLLMAPPPHELVAAITPSVQLFVAAFSGVVLDLLHVPVEREGILLRIPGLTLEVAEQCNGLRFLPILVVFACAFARLALPTTSAQLRLIGLSIPVAVLANAARVSASGVGAHVIGPEAASGPLHYYIGKGCWTLAFVAVIGLAWRLRSHVVRAAAGRRGAIPRYATERVR